MHSILSGSVVSSVLAMLFLIDYDGSTYKEAMRQLDYVTLSWTHPLMVPHTILLC